MPLDRRNDIDNVFAAHLDLLERVRGELAGKILEAAQMWVRAFRAGHRLLLFGNGGSASDALHIEGELANRFCRDRRGLPALALGASLATLTAAANDYAYGEVFARLVETYGGPGDVAVGLSTSGRSPNVVKGLERARELGLETMALTGEGGGTLAAQADLLIAVPSRDTARIQEAHIVIGHILCGIVEEELFGTQHG
ncbi:MAG: SIS domain-containing protein [Planctomycetota bacterium]